MATENVPAVTALAASALTMAAVEAGLPLGIGFALVGILGALVGHARWTVEQEIKNPDFQLPLGRHMWMIARATLMAEFVCLVLLFIWIEYRWPWTWGLITGAIASVFASEAIELMWAAVKARAGAIERERQ